MELNEEAVKKSLDWLDSLVGNSNDSDMALITYQLLGILYDTCEELTEENKAWQMQLISQEEKSGKAYYELACEVEDLRKENENLHASCTELTQECKKWQGRVKIECEYTKADTVREMQERLKEKAFSVPTVYNSHFGRMVDQIAKEMLDNTECKNKGEEICKNIHQKK